MSLEFTKLAEVGEATELADGDYILAVKDNTVQKIEKSLVSSDGVFIIDLDELGSEYGTYDASKLTAWGEFYEKVKALFVSGSPILIKDLILNTGATRQDGYYHVTSGVCDKNTSSGYDNNMKLSFGNETITLYSESQAGTVGTNAFFVVL